MQQGHWCLLVLEPLSQQSPPAQHFQPDTFILPQSPFPGLQRDLEPLECESLPSTSGWLVCKRFELWEKSEKCQQLPGTRGSGGTRWEGTAGGQDMESWAQTLPWAPEKELRRKISPWHLTHVCLLGLRASWMRTMITFLQVPLFEVPRAGEAAVATGTFYPPLTWVGLHPKPVPGTSLAITEPRSGLPCSHFHQLPQSGAGTGTAQGAWCSWGHALQGEEGIGGPKVRRSPGMDVPHSCWVLPPTPLSLCALSCDSKGCGCHWSTLGCYLALQATQAQLGSPH